MTGTLVLLRHGESEWNMANLFTGWHDVELSEQGREEAAEAGRVLAETGLSSTSLHTSLQTRAIVTANLALESMDQLWLPVERTWRLNERHYGDLQGKDKKQTAEEYGADQVKVWRRSYDMPPPAVDRSDHPPPRNDPRYRHLAARGAAGRRVPGRRAACACCRSGRTRIVPALRAGRACWWPPTATACGPWPSTWRA